MRYQIINTKKFDRDLKRCAKRGLPMKRIAEALRILAETGTLPDEYRPHKLSGNYAGKWECQLFYFICVLIWFILFSFVIKNNERHNQTF